MKPVRLWMVWSMLALLSPELAASPPVGSSVQALSCRNPRATAPASSLQCTVPEIELATGFPDLAEPTAHVAIGAQRATIDRQTGRLVVPRRPTLELPQRRLDSFRVPYGALRQQRLPGGGWKLGLQGRMLTPIFATIDPDGQPAPTHTWEPVDEARR